MQPTHARWKRASSDNCWNQKLSHARERGRDQGEDRIAFPPLASFYARRFLVTDTYFETPSTSTLGYPGLDEALIDVDPPGLMHVAEEVIAELPDDCRREFVQARAHEQEWKSRWKTEGDGRAKLKITYNA